jgi:hypothetical protein
LKSKIKYNIINNKIKNNIKMQISLAQQIDIDNAEKNLKTKCFFCESKINLQATYYDNKIINACFLCHITVNYDKEYIYHCLLCNTQMSQIDIIKKTFQFYKKEGYIPYPNEIDPEAKILKIPIYFFANFTKEAKQKLNKFCLFFTNKTENMLIDEFMGVFEDDSKKKKIKTDLLNYYDTPEYNPSEEENNIIEKEIDIIKNNNYKIVTEEENKIKVRFSQLI